MNFPKIESIHFNFKNAYTILTQYRKSIGNKSLKFLNNSFKILYNL